MPNDQQPLLYVVRHGTTELNEDGRFRGPLDPKLDAKGLQDAQKLANYFANIPIGDAWTSDKTRAQQTADTILDPKGMAASPDPNLRAWNVGYLAGEKKSTHQDDIGFYQRHADVSVPGGESLNKFRQRVRMPLLQAIAAGKQNGVPSLVVSHSSIVHELGNIIHGDHTAVKVQPGGVAGVFLGNDGKLSFQPLVKPVPKESQEGEGYGW